MQAVKMPRNIRQAKAKQNLWNDALNINELVIILENISADDKRPLESYSAKEIVAEAKYLLSTFFEPGHINGDAYAGEHEHDVCNQAWAAEQVRNLRIFIKKYGRLGV